MQLHHQFKFFFPLLLHQLQIFLCCFLFTFPVSWPWNGSRGQIASSNTKVFSSVFLLPAFLNFFFLFRLKFFPSFSSTRWDLCLSSSNIVSFPCEFFLPGWWSHFDASSIFCTFCLLPAHTGKLISSKFPPFLFVTCLAVLRPWKVAFCFLLETGWRGYRGQERNRWFLVCRRSSQLRLHGSQWDFQQLCQFRKVPLSCCRNRIKFPWEGVCLGS